MIRPGRLGIVGGTFDPIHWGHLDAAAAATDALALTDVVFVPSHVPPHRPEGPRASAFHRFAMAALATQSLTYAGVSDVELARSGPSYSADTLAAFHTDGWHASQIYFIIGADAFAEIATWRAYPALLEMCHFVVISRDRTAADVVIARNRQAQDRLSTPASCAAATSTTVIPLAADTRPVSSTMVRARIAAGVDITGLVPQPVATYIARHALYRQGQELA